jgi:DNA-binding GntR family transcriptional regulator
VALSPDDPRPPYLQIAENLRGRIASGRLASGEQLPSASDLAEQFGVARNTVRSALRVLSEEGLLVARQGHGVFVRSEITQPPASTAGGQENGFEMVMRQLSALARDVQQLGERLSHLEQLVDQQNRDS